jgi:hypothetical protein
MIKFPTGLAFILCRPASAQVLAGALLLGSVGAVAAHHAAGHPDLEALTGASDLIVRARTIGQESRLEEGQISTYVRLQVIEAIKGEPPTELEIRIPGGVIPIQGGPPGLMLEAAVPQAPRFQENAESVLFLSARQAMRSEGPALIPQVVGLSHGKIDIAADGSVVAPAARRVTIQVGPGAVSAPTAGQSGGPRNRGGRMPASELVAQIRTHLRGGR